MSAVSPNCSTKNRVMSAVRKMQVTKIGDAWKRMLICLLFFGLACNKDEDQDQTPSSLQFNYSGSVSGRFSAVGDLPEPPLPMGTIFYEYAAAERETHVIDQFRKEDWIKIVANFPKSQTLPVSNSIIFHFPQKGTGTFPVYNDWVGTMVSIDGEVGSFVEGTVQVTYFNSGRIKGTFQGRVAGGMPRKEMQITGGQFDMRVQ